jgi:cold shock CspA family protein
MSRDQLLPCADCGASFIWTIAEQTTGPQPARCPSCRLLSPAQGRQRGTVKWFSRGKGYGFITRMVGADLFVHRSGLAAGQPLLCAGQLVEFAVASAGRGAHAEDVVALLPMDGKDDDTGGL